MTSKVEPPGFAEDKNEDDNCLRVSSGGIV